VFFLFDEFLRVPFDADADVSFLRWQALQAAVQKIHTYVTTLEEKVDLMERRKK